MNSMERTAAPRAGRSLEGIVAPLRAHVIDAVAKATQLVDEAPDWILSASTNDSISKTDSHRGAWAHVAILMIDSIRTGLPPNMERAACWFGINVNASHWTSVENALAPLSEVSNLSNLLPYLLDTFGRTTRLDVLRDSTLSGSREKRKKVGSFYTPQDLADFMVGTIASAPDAPEATTEWWLDPALGSGVFLVSALRNYSKQMNCDPVKFATQRLAGFDISPQACDFSSFSILGHISKLTHSPFETWAKIRGNMIALDSTAGAPSRGAKGLREMLEHFDGPMRLICNPPYASTENAKAALSHGRPTKTLYLPFVEMSWRLASGQRDCACLVVPLALGANRSLDHRHCRLGMSAASGEWTLLFFDRQPSALFGEEAKTRAAIAIRRPGPSPALVRSSRMLKWTSRQRAAIFTEERAVHLNGLSIGRIVPKLGGQSEVDLYRALQSFQLRSQARPEPTKAKATEIVGSALAPDVFVSATAYNFLNVFRNYPDQLSWRGTLSASGIHRLPCASMEEADAVLAILVSRLTFWLWHVECDGFHVPTWFLSELPLLNLSLSKEKISILAELGRTIWCGLQSDIICSSNRAKITFAFRPTEVSKLRDEVDKILVEAISADTNACEMLRVFEAEVVSIDGSVRLSQPKKKTEQND